MPTLRSLLALATLFLAATPTISADTPPPIPREFRGVWVATVANIDWPSEPGLPVKQQKSELIAIFDRAVELNFNAIILQVRPSADALYKSNLEPWSVYLTGKQGRPPKPFYDPLAFAVEQAHARGLQLHAWINPYRAHANRSAGGLDESHFAKQHPELVKEYGDDLWMDPGSPLVQRHSLAVVADIITRYEVDGIHLDDYFYPYPVRDDDGELVPFPDDKSFQRYQQTGGTLGRDDWRRNNVNQFVKRLYQLVKDKRPTALVGLSPFGIWRPGHPEQIRGLDAYKAIYADSRKWFRMGWCDYLSPQLYWPIGQTAQDYIALENWWIEQNIKHRHLWPGLYTSGVGRKWEPIEIVKQIKASRASNGATGNIHFSMKALMGEREGLEQAIKKLYAEQALVPASPWLQQQPPQPVRNLTVSKDGSVSWTGNESTARWVIQFHTDEGWKTQILPGTTTSFNPPQGYDEILIRAVNQTGQLSEPVQSL